MKTLARLAAQLTDLFFPPRCIGCARAGFAFCPHCAQRVLPVLPPICAHCGRPQRHSTPLCLACRKGERDAFALVRVATVYKNPLRPAIHGLKYGGQPELGRLLARYLIAVAQQPPWPAILPEIDGVIPVPLHAERMTERGYNQSALLAGGLAEGVGLTLRETWLRRDRLTRSQVGLSAVERRQNVIDAFQADPAVQGKRLLLVDDLFTTGATLTACAHALHAAGAEAVYGLALSTPAPSADDDALDDS